jgi:hypothetical protein
MIILENIEFYLNILLRIKGYEVNIIYILIIFNYIKLFNLNVFI